MRYALILTTIFLCLSSPGFSQDTRTDTVKAAVGNIREKPGTDAPIVHRVYRGDTLTIYRQEGKWFYVKLPDGEQGWAHRILFMIPDTETRKKLAETPIPEPFRASLSSLGGNIREYPSRKAAVIRVLKKGDTVTIVDKEGNWYRVKLDDGTIGWAHTSLFSPPSDEPKPETEPMAEEKPKTKKESETEAKPEPEKQLKKEPSPDAKPTTESKPHGKPEAKPKPVPEEKPESKQEPMPEKKLKPGPETIPGKKPEPVLETMSGKEPVREITSIQTIVFSDTEEKVLFTLSGFFPPKASTISGELPQVVCDFIGARPGAGISDNIRAEGKFIQQITVETNDTGTKVSVILSPKHDYNIEQIFYEKEKIYSLIFRKM